MITLLLTLGLGWSAEGEVHTRLADGARVNWTRMRVEVLGEARDDKLAVDTRPLEQSAIASIDDRVGEVAGQVLVRGRRTLDDVVDGLNATARATWTIAENHYFRDGHVVVMGTIDLLPLLASWSRARAVPPPPMGVSGPSGVVIDARGHEVTPSFAPRIKDPDGALLYDAVLWRDAAFGSAPVVWVSDPASPHAGRAGDTPLFLQVDGTYGDELVVARADAERLRDAVGGTRVMGDGTVVIVVDP